MPPITEGDRDAKGFKVALLASRFNESVTSKLLDGAMDALLRHGADPGDVTVVKVPGAFELPQTAAKLAGQKRFDAIVALGCLLRGETAHYELLSSEAVRGLSQSALATGVPVTFGVLTCDTEEQALARAGGDEGNKGWDAALAAIEMASLYRRLA